MSDLLLKPFGTSTVLKEEVKRLWNDIVDVTWVTRVYVKSSR